MPTATQPARAATSARDGDPGAPARPRPRLTPRRRHDFWTFLVFVGPNLALIVVFCWVPVFVNLQYSFLNWTLGSKRATNIGLGNYVEFFTGEGGQVLWTTFVFTVVTVGGSMLLGLLLSLLLNRRLFGTTAARATVFAPYVLSGVGIGLVWTFIFDPVIGILSQFQRALGWPVPQWFTDPDLSLAMVSIVFIWKNLGYNAVIYLAGLQAVPHELHEAASIDGAGPVQRFFTVTLPLLGPTTFFLVLTNTLSSLQAFDIIRIMTPLGNGTTTLMYDVYLQAFGGYNRGGYSAALSMILFLILVVVTVIQMRFMQRRVHYA